MGKEQKQSPYPWHKAPERAKYAATDSNGARYWFECKPVLKGRDWYATFGACELIELDTDWKQTLQTRPNNL